MQAAPHVTDEIELEFLTPTSIKVNKQWMRSHLTFEHLIRNLLRRIRFLSYFHCGEDLDVDAPRIESRLPAPSDTDPIFAGIRCRPIFLPRREIHSDGWVYRVRFVFTGELEPFLPFIYLGEYLHIGHHTAFRHLGSIGSRFASVGTLIP